MADNKFPRRPVAGSRAPSRSPKRLAGQPARPEPTVESPSELTAEDEVTTPDVPSAPPPAPEPPAADGVLNRPKTTKVLAVLVAAVALLFALLAVLQTQAPDRDTAVSVWDPVSRAGEFSLPGAEEVPVTVGPLDWTSAVDEIAHSVTKVLSFSHETIDSQEEVAAELVTPEFLASDLRETIAETAPKLKANKAEYTVTVAGQSVISATPTRVRTLLFVNQLVTKGTGDDAVSDNYPLRLDVRGELVNGAWLISALDAG